MLALPQPLGAALDGCDLGLDPSSRRLLALLRVSPAAAPAGARERLAFWTARAGGRASDLREIPPEDLAELRAALDRCEPKLADLAGAELFVATAAFFTDAGAPALRRRSPAERPALASTLAGAAAAGASYDPAVAALFVPLAHGAARGRRAAARGARAGRRAARGGSRPRRRRAPPGRSHPRRALRLHARGGARAGRAPRRARRARPAAGGASAEQTRSAPRIELHAPAKVLGRIALRPAEARPVACATIAYETGAELEQDFVENLSQGGAFVRTRTPA